jgi:hypothetical protein
MAYPNPLSSNSTPVIPIAGVSFGGMGSRFSGSAEALSEFKGQLIPPYLIRHNLPGDSAGVDSSDGIVVGT